MVYTPKWEQLCEALARVVATGNGEDDAKRDICNAVADGKIKVRVWRSSEPDWMVHYDVLIPPRLQPDDFWWPLSRWHHTNRPHPHELGIRQPDRLPLWEAARIELCREDVTNALCNGIDKAQSKLPTAAQNEAVVSTLVGLSRSGRKTQPATQRAQRAIKALYPEGVPDQVTLPNKVLCRQVNEHLDKDTGKPNRPKVPISNDTILRAAGRRK